MGKPQKSRPEKEKSSGKKQQMSQAELTPLFFKRKPDRSVSKMAPAHGGIEEEPDTVREPSDQESDSEEAPDIPTYLANLPSKADIKEMLQEVTATLKEEILDIKRDMISLSTRADDIEANQSKLTANQKAIYTHIQQQDRLILELQRQTEDQENRSRRNNIRVRGIPETVQNEEIHAVLLQIFNSILKKEPDSEIKIERAHRVQKPKAAPLNAPRDILCCLHNFALKEQILLKARDISNLTYEDNTIKLFQDISKTTLTKRKLLKPLTDTLRDNNIPYRWGYPFSLTATKDGNQAIIRTPMDTTNFIKKLHLDEMELPGWLPDQGNTLNLSFELQGEWSQATPRRTPHTPRTPRNRTRQSQNQ
uniref:L1 transposable element RRM domain-containing protein n=1 Tax=Xenopus tropicalis TaxID=8364 RepID=A0A803J6A6_XENTR